MAGGAFSLLFLLALLGLGIAYLSTLANTLAEIQPKNRKTEPSSVWLMFIPLFNIVWQFILYKKLTDSITNEYRSKGLTDTADNSNRIGRLSAIALLAGSLIRLIFRIGGAEQSILSLIGIFAWIAFWIQISNHKKKIISLPRENDNDSLIFNDP